MEIARHAGRLAVAVCALLIVGASVATATTRVAVVATDADETNPAASIDYTAWNVWNGTRHIVYARQTGGARFRVSSAGVNGYLGGIDGTRLVYQEFEGNASDIYLYDLETKTRSIVPDPVSTALEWEYHPSISGDWLLFARWSFPTPREVFLYNMVTEEMRLIASTPDGPYDPIKVHPGQVNGDFAVYDRITEDSGGAAVACDVFRYQISTQERVKLPNPNGRCQFSPSVNAAGTTYFGRSGFRCGHDASVQKMPIGGLASTIVSLRDGRDFSSSFALDNGDGTTDVFYDPGRCGADSDIYKVTDAA